MSYENRIAPRLRPGEVMPTNPDPERKVPTRYHGEIVFVSARTEDDRMRGNSPYTETQVLELEGIRVAKQYLRRQQELFSALVGVTVGSTLEDTIIDFGDTELGNYLDYKDFER